MSDVRIAYFGDSLTNGTGDDECLGFCGRASAIARRAGVRLTHYNLGVRRQTSVQIEARWEHEARSRLSEGATQLVVFSFGVNDVSLEEGVRRVRLEDSLATARTLMDRAQSLYSTRWIGPPPVLDEARNEALVELDAAYAKLASEASVPYFRSLAALGPVYREALTRGDGWHPTAAGYAEWAERLTSWDAWFFSPSGAVRE
ncbi:MAG: GDSL-type esterase/lipase family protein [Polyangiales bacterium]